MLNLTSTTVADISPLTQLTELEELTLRGTAVSNLHGIDRLTSLRKLDLAATEVRDLTPLTSLPSLEVLSIEGVPVADLRPLRDMPGMQNPGERDGAGCAYHDTLACRLDPSIEDIVNRHRFSVDRMTVEIVQYLRGLNDSRYDAFLARKQGANLGFIERVMSYFRGVK